MSPILERIMAKGSQYERDICRKLSLWMSHNKRDDYYWRSAGSGSRATQRQAQGKTTKGHAGDIAPTCGEAETLTDLVTIEIKRGYPRSSIHDLLDRPITGAPNTYQVWIEQAEKASEASGTYAWLLITKRDRRDAIITFPYNLFVKFEHATHSERFYWVFPLFKIRYNDNIGRDKSIASMPLTHFLQAVPPETVREVAAWWSRNKKERA